MFVSVYRAIEHNHIDLALFAGLEMHDIADEILKEACSWIGTGGYGHKHA